MTAKLAYGCGAMRQQDEWYCPLCQTRWGHGQGDKPPCSPVEFPTAKTNKMGMTRTRFQQIKKRANKFRSFR